MLTILMQNFMVGTYILSEICTFKKLKLKNKFSDIFIIISEPSFPISHTLISPERSHIQFLSYKVYLCYLNTHPIKKYIIGTSACHAISPVSILDKDRR